MTVRIQKQMSRAVVSRNASTVRLGMHSLAQQYPGCQDCLLSNATLRQLHQRESVLELEALLLGA